MSVQSKLLVRPPRTAGGSLVGFFSVTGTPTPAPRSGPPPTLLSADNTIPTSNLVEIEGKKPGSPPGRVNHLRDMTDRVSTPKFTGAFDQLMIQRTRSDGRFGRTRSCAWSRLSPPIWHDLNLFKACGGVPFRYDLNHDRVGDRGRSSRCVM
ncbi:hypothetical protein CONPUDRAFT_161816 [Coniophora puteana RWD-64-598 SS2]|uniref:Uncharacterized protein n=1 Tax=Coniophora puteana (strain RWD-64-598) TaxID=741705 RepID=A0A5M3N726_CONPW|nr:uncharacterized protein CONPUDRAFT_161816 [Coniophora puteana RWD-64-598 SS2]EIW87233.1 hypothetical protein CONPUDRAFT_161816 [Coniophora puteana RWD-64-598 SS2]